MFSSEIFSSYNYIIFCNFEERNSYIAILSEMAIKQVPNERLRYLVNFIKNPLRLDL